MSKCPETGQGARKKTLYRDMVVMISFWAERDQNCPPIKSPLNFFINLFKKKKYKVRKSHVKEEWSSGESIKVPNNLSVSVMDMRMSTASPCPLSPALSVLTLTPGRTRDIDQDMEALRLSRQDNPFLQVLASRESLVESLFESESDDTNLMTQEFPNDLEVDPLSLPEIHEHMIRSPPPTTWPKSPNYKVFRFPAPGSEESLQVSSCRRSLHKGISSGSVREEDETSSKDFKFIDVPDICSGNSMTQSVNSPKNEENNSFALLKPTPIRSQPENTDGSQAAEENVSEPKVDDWNGKFDEEVPLTLPLLSKKFT